MYDLRDDHAWGRRTRPDDHDDTLPSPGKRTLVDRLVRGTGGASLDAALRDRLEPSVGSDLSDVRVHTDDAAAESASALEARAYTVGQDVYFGAGEYRPEDPAGQMLIAHEIAHTVQQRGAEAAPARRALEVSEPTDPHEQEAEAFAGAFVSGGALAVRPVAAGVVSRATIQRETTAAPAAGTAAPPAGPTEVAGERKLTIPAFEKPVDLGWATLTLKVESEVSAKKVLGQADAKPGTKLAVLDRPLDGKESKPEPGDDKKTEVAVGLAGSKGKNALSAEVKQGLGTFFKSEASNIEIKGFTKGGFEASVKENKIAVSAGLEGKLFGFPFTVAPELTIASWEPGKKPHFLKVAGTADVPVAKLETTIGGETYTFEGKVKLAAELEPDWAQIGSKIATEVAVRVGPRVLAALPGAIALGAGVLGTAALAAFTQFITSGEWLEYGHSALDVARDYSAGYVDAVKGKPSNQKNQNAAKGYADGLAYLKTHPYPAGAIAAAAAEDADLYEQAWKAMWPGYSEVAVKYYENQHPVRNFFRNDGHHLHNYFLAFYDSPWGGPEKQGNLG